MMVSRAPADQPESVGDDAPGEPAHQPVPKPAPAVISVTWRAVTHQGLMRERNEDSLCAEADAEKGPASRYLFAVADGVGGHGGGEIASRLAMRSLRDEFHAWKGGAAGRFLDRALRNANQVVFNEAHSQPEFARMQTTLTAVVLEEYSLTIGHVGDCRLYRAREGRVELLTRDHSMANELLKMRLISPEQANGHPGRHQLVRSLGGDPFLRTDIIREEIRSGDTYLLCCDGLWGELSDDDIRAGLQEGNASAACERLVRIALMAGAPDNISAIVFRVAAAGIRAVLPFTLRSLFGRR